MGYIDNSGQLKHYKHGFLTETYFSENVATYTHSINLEDLVVPEFCMNFPTMQFFQVLIT